MTEHAVKTITRLTRAICWLALVCLLESLAIFFYPELRTFFRRTPAEQKATAAAVPAQASPEPSKAEQLWSAPDPAGIPAGETGELIRYGKELIVHTAAYLGPQGSVRKISNGMNCQNCHLGAGTKAWALNFSGVRTLYPVYKARDDRMVDAVQRVNGCFERSMNGVPLDTASREMKAMVAYMEWLGKDVPEGSKPAGISLKKLAYLDRAADPEKGQAVFMTYCQSCHGADGQGRLNDKGNEYMYPPLWGPHSYNDGAGLTRLSNFAGFVKNNMPFGTTYEHPLLSDEDAWDVAAFVDSQPRPHKDQRHDYKDLTKKPIDHPEGPYADSFSAKQHKYGPFRPIQSYYRELAAGGKP
ncbi:c-type cytochrome [Compostibacter hankyongensis]|uniref:Cytochrome c domain-containing protein n=1 Tax=Compostibacter hankyongensis TaxID=1007089 RepID=A0ABP8G0T3_9BACT